jgi:hypothetical protein
MTWTSPSENKTGPRAGMLEPRWRKLILGSKQRIWDRMEITVIGLAVAPLHSRSKPPSAVQTWAEP